MIEETAIMQEISFQLDEEVGIPRFSLIQTICRKLNCDKEAVKRILTTLLDRQEVLYDAKGYRKSSPVVSLV
jgi:hypothetical protein